MNLKDHIRHVPDFPKPGILFYDVSTLLAHAEAWRTCVARLRALIEPMQPDVLLGIESRGFLVAAPLAHELGLGFVMVRKKGKLPGATVPLSYDLEYGSDTIEVQQDILKPGARAVVLDDLLATGGTMAAAVDLARKVGADVRGCATIIELTFLKGRDRLDAPFSSLLSYDS